jgi:CheY-like chemotaxis protein
VEDDAPFAQFVISSIRSIAPAVELSLAGRLTTAVSAIEASSFDAILLDLNLPDSQGLETLRPVTAVAPDAAVVVLTATDDAGQAERALRLARKIGSSRDSLMLTSCFAPCGTPSRESDCPLDFYAPRNSRPWGSSRATWRTNSIMS